MSCYKNAINRRQESTVDIKIKTINALNIIKFGLKNIKAPVIAFSGGKDSLVVLDLVRKIRPDTKAVFCNTGNEYPETIPYTRSFDNLVELHPEKSFWQCVREYGLPVQKSKAKRRGNQCCYWLKEKPAENYYQQEHIDLVFTGLTSDESRNRWMFFKRMGHTYWFKKGGYWKCHPIHDWSEEEVWSYIQQNKLEYNPIYDMGIPRCGCRFCTAYLSWKEVTSRYNPKDTQILMKISGYKLLNDFL